MLHLVALRSYEINVIKQNIQLVVFMILKQKCFL